VADDFLRGRRLVASYESECGEERFEQSPGAYAFAATNRRTLSAWATTR
jgi:hypothetical protein